MFKRASERRASSSSSDMFPAPTAGWVQSGNVIEAPRNQAEILDNFIPTAQGARLRGGKVEYADVGATVRRIFTYTSNTESFFGSTDDSIFDLDRLNGGGSNTFAEVEGLSSGDFSAVQISTAGGQFLVAASGADNVLYFDGADWNPINGAAINDLSFDAETTAFTVGDTVTGGTSGATAEILAITKTSATAGTLKLGAITGGPYQDNEALTDGAGGAATADGASASGSAVTITGVDTANLNQVWSYKERLFFVEKNTTKAWYLPVESIGGAASSIDLGSVFRRGGKLLFGATWSLDSGDGIDDVCLFISSLGEVAVYNGTNPGSASTWALSGVYQIGEPLDKHSFFRSGGDVGVLTEDGIIPISEALRKDRAALQPSALTYPIEDAWRSVISSRSTSFPISATLWQAKTLLLVGTPGKANNQNVSFVANTRTGAWGRITGWDVRCSGIFGDELYFGCDDGKVYKADTGGTDAGLSFTGVYVPKFSYAPQLRSANAVQVIYKAPVSMDVDLDAWADYEVGDMGNPATTSTPATATWGAGVWGTFVWGGEDNSTTFTEWQSAYADGYALAPSLTLTVNQTSSVDFEILSMQVRYEVGYNR